MPHEMVRVLSIEDNADDHGKFAASHIPGAQLVPMEEGGHLALMLDSNNGARERVLQFLEEYNSR